MAMKEIEIIVDPQGNVKLEASGFEGSACELEMGELQQVLGQAERHERKPEYHRRPSTVVGRGKTVGR